MPRPLVVLVLALPVAFVVGRVGGAPLLVFILAALALIPLAGLIATATGALAEHLGERLGGLLNATFGNAAELIIGISALAAGLPNVVRASIAGSIIGNALLVLGSAMFLGGWRFGLQRFDARTAGQYAAMLALAVVGLVLPSMIATTTSATGDHAVSAAAQSRLSVIVAAVLLASYGAYIAFTVFGVRAGRPELAGAGDAGDGAGEVSPERASRPPRRRPATGAGPRGTRQRLERWWRETLWAPLAALAGATALTAAASELLVSAIEPVTRQVGLGQFFVGLIVLPIVGNAAEHSSAIAAAARDRMETAMAITAGSSIQVALLVAPVLVLLSRFIGTPLDLTFSRLELVIFALVAGLYALVSLDGESTWLEGAQLFAFYVIVAVSAFFIPT